MNTLIIPFLLATALVAQESRKLDPKALLQKALVIEKQEQDPKRALELLEELVKTAQDEAVKKQVEAEAQRIRRSLQGDSEEIYTRVATALTKLRKDEEATWKNGISDLLFAGDACIPMLAKEVEAESRDRLFITHAVQALVEIGTERAAATLERIVEKGDEFRRKAALLGAVAANKVNDRMKKALGAFVKAGSYKLTVEALDTIGGKLTREDLIAKLDEREHGDARQEVREAAGRALCRIYQGGGWDNDWKKENPRIIAILDKLIRDNEAFAARTAVILAIVESSEGRGLLLKALAAFPAEINAWAARFGNQLPYGFFAPASDDEQVELCLAAARALKGEPVASPARNELRRAIPSLLPRWTRAALPAAVECAELGFEDSSFTAIEQFIARVAKQEDAALVVRALPVANGGGNLSAWLGNHDLPSGSVDAVRSHVESKLKPDSGAIQPLLIAIARTRDPKHVAWVFGLCRDNAETYWVAGMHALLVASKDPITPEIQKALEETLVMKVTTLPGRNSVAYYRNAIFARLVQIGSKAGLEGFAKAYELGLAEARTMDFSPNLFSRRAGAGYSYRGLRWTGALRDVDSDRHRVGYDEATIAQVFAKVLGSKHPEAWNDAHVCADELDRFPIGVAEQLADASFDCPQTTTSQRGQPLQTNVATYLLNGGAARSPKAWTYLVDLSRRGKAVLVKGMLAGIATLPPESQPVLEALLESSDTIAFALDRLGKLGAKDLVERTVKLLSHAEPSVRWAALMTLVSLDKERARREIHTLAADADANVRMVFAGQAGVLGDQVFVPDLLRLLRDDVPGVRDAAKSSLDRIRFLVEQDAFWSRLSKQSGIDAPSAAEALLKKAKKDQPKPARLLALDSLGTLAVPETLPFLIELCADEDKEIAEHAAAAVKRINAK